MLNNKFVTFLLSIFCFILIVDPPNVIFKIKDVVYILLIISCIYSYRKFSVKRTCLFLAVYMLLIITFIRGDNAGYLFDYEYSALMFKAFSPLLLLLWIDKITLLNKITLPSVCVGIICIFITCTMFWFPDIETIIYNFFADNDHFVMISRREFLGMTFTGVFYRSLPLLIIPCSIYSYKFWFSVQSSKKHFIISLILFAALFFSGTRASMLSALIVFGGTAIMKFRKMKGGMIILYLLFTLGVIVMGTLLFLLLSETKEDSNEIKYGHLYSYIKLFSEHIDILFCGQGVGAMFYTQGFGKLTTQTEWSFIELIRYFGILGALFVTSIYFYPVCLIWKKRTRLKYAFPLIVGYILYLLIAGTNPLLISSTGMLALLVAYSYACNPVYQNNS